MKNCSNTLCKNSIHKLCIFVTKILSKKKGARWILIWKGDIFRVVKKTTWCSRFGVVKFVKKRGIVVFNLPLDMPLTLTHAKMRKNDTPSFFYFYFFNTREKIENKKSQEIHQWNFGKFFLGNKIWNKLKRILGEKFTMSKLSKKEKLLVLKINDENKECFPHLTSRGILM